MTKPDYGLDAPGIVLGALGAGVAVAVLSPLFLPNAALAGAGGALIAAGLAMYWSSRHGKLGIRDRLLDDLGLRGHEHVLDVGCGRGLLLIAAAKRLTTGKAAGLDLWVQADQLHNTRDVTVKNAELEGVSSRVEVVDGDMREMPFGDATFDAVVSNLAIHNVPSADGRKRAIAEIIRVLKPRGRIAIVDLAFTATYESWLQDAGFVGIRRIWPARWFFPPLGIVVAEKPGGST